MTLYILWKGWRGRRERRDGIYRHWLLYVQNVCVYQGKYKYLRRCYSLSLRCDFSHHLSLSLPMCLTPPQNMVGEEQWSQHSHSPAESTRLSPAFLSPFISFSLAPPGQEKTPATLYTGGGRGLSVHLINPSAPPPSSPFYLVSEAAKLKEKEEKEEMHSFSPSCCLSVCELWLIFNDWFKKK